MDWNKTLNEIDKLWHEKCAQQWKIIISVVCMTLLINGYSEGYGTDTPWWTHIIYIMCHANVFHLAGNLLCLWLMKGRLHMPEAMTIAIAASFLPSVTPEGSVTLGLSGVLFAIVGIKWGKACRFTGMLKYCLPAVIITALFPNVNWVIHAYTLFLGYAYGWAYKKLWR